MASTGFGAPLALTNGVPLTGLSGAAASETFYAITVPAGQDQLLISTSGGTGDCDMYIKRGARPTTSDWDYRPADGGNEESIEVGGSNLSGRWYILLVADQAYSGATLKAHYFHYEKPAPDVKRLTQGVPVTDLAGKAGSQQFFSIEVPSTVQTFEIRMSGGPGDADLYVRKGELPTTSEYDYRPYLTGSNEQVTITKSTAGTWFIMIRGYQAFSGVSLVVTFGAGGPDGAVVLVNGVALTGLAGGAASEKFYKIEVPAGQTKLEIAMSGGTGDADLYVRIGAEPTTTSYDCRPYKTGSNESCTVTLAQPSTINVMVRGYAASSTFDLVGKAQ